MEKKFLLTPILIVLFVFYVQSIAQISDPVGDASPPSVDYVEHVFEQQGESLYVSVTMAEPIAERIPGYSTHTFFTDTDFDNTTGQISSRVGSENNLTFTDLGNGYWYMNLFVLWDHDPNFNAFAHRSMAPVNISEDGKTMSYKFSLVGLGWEELSYDFNGWYKDGSSWHQVPHLPGDGITDVGLYAIDNGQVTALVTKEGSKCIVQVPEPYSATADAKNITDVVDEMVNLVQSEIGTISDASKKYTVTYEVFSDYAHPQPYSSFRPNTFTMMIPGTEWVDQPNWFAMLDGLVNLTLFELNEGAGEVFLTQHAYHIPIPASPETWYTTRQDSSNGFLFEFIHKHTFKALIGRAFENCLVFYLAEQLTDGEAKDAIMAKKTEAQTAWSNFSGTARELNPTIMTGFLLAQTNDLSWTETIYKMLMPATLNLDDANNRFTRLVNDYIRNDSYTITSSDDFEEQLHHGWYASIASVQAAALGLAMDEDVYGELQTITDFPLDQAVFNGATNLLGRVEDQIYGIDEAVPYAWNEINTIGTALTREQFTSSFTGGNPDTDDGSAGPIYMGMSFDFYGNVFDSIYIGINGQLSFSDKIDWITQGGYGQTIPGMGWNNILCPLAADIMGAEAYPQAPYNTATGTIYYYHDANAGTFTVEYSNMTNHFHIVDNQVVDTTVTFQVVLNANDKSITYYYKDLGSAPEPVAKRATIGIQPSRDETLGVQYYGGNVPPDGYPTNETAVRFLLRSVTAIDDEPVNNPTRYQLLSQNYPNPFNPTTTINFTINKAGVVDLKIYNILGQKVRTLIYNRLNPGTYDIIWDGRDDHEKLVPSGVYIYTLRTRDFTQSRKMVLLK